MALASVEAANSKVVVEAAEQLEACMATVQAAEPLEAGKAVEPLETSMAPTLTASLEEPPASKEDSPEPPQPFADISHNPNSHNIPKTSVPNDFCVHPSLLAHADTQ